MKITAVLGSPRKKGNTYKYVENLREKLLEMQDYEFEYIFLSDTDLKTCKGCFVCISKGEELCPLKDERESIEKKMLESSGIILASPNFTLNMSWLMKNFFDRFAYCFHRPRFFEQNIFVVTTSGSEYGIAKVIEKLEVFFFTGFKSVTKSGKETPPFEQKKKCINKNNKKLNSHVLKFHKKLQNNKKPKATLGSIIQFNVFKKVISLGKDKFPKDYEYWLEKRWLDKEKYYTKNAKTGFLKRLSAKFISRIAEKNLKQNYYL